MPCSEVFLWLEHSQVLVAGVQQPVSSARQTTVRKTELNFTWKRCKQVIWSQSLAGICSRCIVHAIESSVGWICRGQMGWSALSNHALHPTCPGAILASSCITTSCTFCWEHVSYQHASSPVFGSQPNGYTNCLHAQSWRRQMWLTSLSNVASVRDTPCKSGKFGWV